jgi:hypothetical protein
MIDICSSHAASTHAAGAPHTRAPSGYAAMCLADKWRQLMDRSDRPRAETRAADDGEAGKHVVPAIEGADPTHIG